MGDAADDLYDWELRQELALENAIRGEKRKKEKQKMAFEQRENSGALFKNDRKEKDTHPDYNGTANIEGVDYYINAWLKEGKNGKFFSFSFKRKDGAPASQSPRHAVRDLDDPIPF